MLNIKKEKLIENQPIPVSLKGIKDILYHIISNGKLYL